MQTIINNIKELFKTFDNSPIISIDRLPQSGGDRMYFRILTGSNSYIATFNNNVKENITFLNLTRHFKKISSPVPEIYIVNDSQTIYIQQDFGNDSLLDIIEQDGHTKNTYQLFEQTLKSLAWLQIKGDKHFDYNWCITSKKFGRQAIISDLLYFKYYFLDTLKIPYNKEKLIDDFEALAIYLTKAKHKYFMFRDFQSRNVMVKNNAVHFIDYQGGMRGALQYDVASLLWQAKANLSDDWKNSLLEYYIDCAEKILKKPVSRKQFRNEYNGYVLIRLLQVLGAYGFRGLFERKAHFLTSIPLALKNMKWFITNKHTGIAMPEFEKVLNAMTSEEMIKRFEHIQANASTPLVVKIKSFSYLISGYPKDESQNGGGFVFDCRGILNPGRFEEYKSVNGRDKSVMDFLEQRTKMPEFLNAVYNIIDIAVENYIERGFENLMISFGCTGGCHRSVYAADALARHVRNKFKVKLELHHIEQNIFETKGFLKPGTPTNKFLATNIKAMILAAGLGTRLKPFTDKHPKALAMVNDKTLLQRNIEYLQSFGIKDVIVNVHHFADQVIDLIKNNNGFGSNIIFSDETDKVLETGGGLKKASWFFKDNEAFILLNADVLTDMNLGLMIKQHLHKKPLATLAVTDRKSSRYFLFDENENLCGWKNEVTGEQKMSKEVLSFKAKAFSGIHIISPEIFSMITLNEKFSMVDVYLDLAKSQAITAFDHSSSKFIDVGTPEAIVKAEELFI